MQVGDPWALQSSHAPGKTVEELLSEPMFFHPTTCLDSVYQRSKSTLYCNTAVKWLFAGIRSWSGDFRRKACFLVDEREDFPVVPVDVLTKGE